MSIPLLIVYVMLAVTLARAVLAAHHRGPSSCSRCGRPFERRALGETICGCD